MHVYRSLAEVPSDFGPSVVSIGNFDGVHFGHRRILHRVKEIAAERGWKASVLTFDPHPTRVVAPERTPPSVDVAGAARGIDARGRHRTGLDPAVHP